MNYDLVPTTVFTPLEYDTIGLTEEAAKEKFGAENIFTPHTKFQPLEWALREYNTLERLSERTYVKVLVNRADNNRVVGFHLLAPNAGEITQGMGIGFKLGMTLE